MGRAQGRLEVSKLREHHLKKKQQQLCTLVNRHTHAAHTVIPIKDISTTPEMSPMLLHSRSPHPEETSVLIFVYCKLFCLS